MDLTGHFLLEGLSRRIYFTIFPIGDENSGYPCIFPALVREIANYKGLIKPWPLRFSAICGHYCRSTVDSSLKSKYVLNLRCLLQN